MKAKTTTKSLREGEGSFIDQKGGSTAPALHNRYAYRVTDTVRNSINGDLHTDPIAKQYIPQNAELKILPDEDTDPIGDSQHTPIKGIVHRYPDRVLFKPANICAVYCRYCFRREHVGPGSNILNTNEREAALDYIRQNKDIWEVILTGGDPLILSPKQIGEIINALNRIDHVKIIRIHTRIPIADPVRLTDELIKTLQSDKPVYMALHINHAQELTQQTRTALEKLNDIGVQMLSQSVLLKGVNDNAETLAELYRELLSLNVKPYYLHHPDLTVGTSHFRMTIEEGQKIMRELQGHISGLAMPRYMLDIPGGHGKISLNPDSITPLGNGGYKIKDRHGVEHIYAPEHESKNAGN